MTDEKRKSSSLLYTGAITLAACMIYAMGTGIRSNFGIMLGTISESSGISYSSVSFVLAVAQLTFGIMQPVFGMIAIKKSNPFVLICGIVMMVGGLMMIPFSHSLWMLMLSLGILLPGGTGAVSFGIIMGAITPKLEESRVPAVSGIVNASSGVGNTVMSPIIQMLLSAAGLLGAMVFLSIPTLLLLPVSLWLCRDKSGAGESGAADKEQGRKQDQDQSIGSMIMQALKSPVYWGLMIGFFTCGFHMAIIETHLYTQITSYGLPEQTAALTFSVYGIATMLGSVCGGVISGKVRMKTMLGVLYGSRAVITALFLLLPKNLLVIFGFTILLGLTGGTTVIPTSGLVSKTFGAEKLAMLFGFVFFIHQIGSFLSAWIGGLTVGATGGYTVIWCINIVLAALASVFSFRIPE